MGTSFRFTLDPIVYGTININNIHNANLSLNVNSATLRLYIPFQVYMV